MTSALTAYRIGKPPADAKPPKILPPAPPKPRNDASRTLLHGSASLERVRSDLAFHGSTPVVSAKATQGFKCSLIIAALLTFASGICQAQPAGIGDGWAARFDRAEARANELTAATDRHTHALGAIGDNVREAIEALKALGVGAFWLVVLGGCFALAYKVLDIVKAWMLLMAARGRE